MFTKQQHIDTGLASRAKFLNKDWRAGLFVVQSLPITSAHFLWK